METWGPGLCHEGDVRAFLVVSAYSDPAHITTAILACSLVYFSVVVKSPPLVFMLPLVLPAIALTTGITLLDRYGQYFVFNCAVGAFGFFGFRKKFFVLLPVVTNVISIIVLAVTNNCNNVIIVALDMLCFIAAILAIFYECKPLQRPSVQKSLAFVEGGLVTLILSNSPALLQDRETHLTWWGLLTLAVFDWFYVRGVADIIWLAALIFFLNIVAGVWYMSIEECGVLVDTLSDVGFLKYAVGNFAMHYWPFIRIILHVPEKIKNPARQLSMVLGLLALYCATRNPSHVYRCNQGLQPWATLLSFWGLTLASTTVIAVCGPWVYPTLL